MVDLCAASSPIGNAHSASVPVIHIPEGNLAAHKSIKIKKPGRPRVRSRWPLWGGGKEAEQELNRLGAALDDATENLLDIPPTTIAGAAALLAYAAHHVSGGGGESWPNGEAWMSRRGVEWEVILHRNLAKALQAMAVWS